MIKKIIKIIMINILIIVLPFLLSGCWDYSDAEKRSIVISIGVDRVKDQIEFSSEVARMVSQVGEKREEAKTPNVYSDLSYGKTFEEARMDFNSRRPYPTFLGATRVVVFGTNLAKKSIEPYLNRINNLYDFRKTLLAVISREPPREIFKLKIEKDISVGFLIDDTIRFLADKGSTLYPTIGEIISYIELGEVGYVLPYVGIEQESIKYLGLAVLKDSKLQGIIMEKDSKGLLYITAEKLIFHEILPGLKNKENNISFRVMIDERKINTDYVNNQIIINFDLNINAQLQYQYFIEPVTEEDIKLLETLLSEKIEKYVVDIIKKTKDEYRSDIFQFAQFFRADNPEIYKKIKWSKEYPDSKINIKVKVKIMNQNMYDSNAKKII